MGFPTAPRDFAKPRNVGVGAEAPRAGARNIIAGFGLALREDGPPLDAALSCFVGDVAEITVAWEGAVAQEFSHRLNSCTWRLEQGSARGKCV